MGILSQVALSELLLTPNARASSMTLVDGAEEYGELIEEMSKFLGLERQSFPRDK